MDFLGPWSQDRTSKFIGKNLGLFNPLPYLNCGGGGGGVFIPPKNMGENFDKSLKMY